MPVDDIERLALLGWRLYPSAPTGKKGLIRGGSDRATYDLNQLAAWSQEFPRANWRVVFGGSGIWAIDCDVPPLHKDDGVQGMKDLVAVHGPLPKMPLMRSGGGGLVMFFRDTGAAIIGESGHPAPGCDPRRGRQSQTIPPSLHHTTRRPYRWLRAPWEISPPDAPTWLLRLVEPPPVPAWVRAPVATTDRARQKLMHAVMAVTRAPEGTRNDVLNRRSYQIGRYIAQGLVDHQEGVDLLVGAARSTGLPFREAALTIKSGIEAGLRYAG
jgi:hypothetical protein